MYRTVICSILDKVISELFKKIGAINLKSLNNFKIRLVGVQNIFSIFIYT